MAAYTTKSLNKAAVQQYIDETRHDVTTRQLMKLKILTLSAQNRTERLLDWTILF